MALRGHPRVSLAGKPQAVPSQRRLQPRSLGWCFVQAIQTRYRRGEGFPTTPRVTPGDDSDPHLLAKNGAACYVLESKDASPEGLCPFQRTNSAPLCVYPRPQRQRAGGLKERSQAAHRLKKRVDIPFNSRALSVRVAGTYACGHIC